jgi:2-C-methyl-D-erythritol 4-phosphate cytidylyltransferase
MSTSEKTTSILLASGTGQRFHDQQPKQFLKLAGLPILVHTMKVFQNCSKVDEIIVVCRGKHHE